MSVQDRSRGSALTSCSQRRYIQSWVSMIIFFKQKMDTLRNFDMFFWIVETIFLNFLRFFAGKSKKISWISMTVSLVSNFLKNMSSITSLLWKIYRDEHERAARLNIREWFIIRIYLYYIIHRFISNEISRFLFFSQKFVTHGPERKNIWTEPKAARSVPK